MPDESLFGEEGNYEDYWLGTPAYDNTRIMDDEGWSSAEAVIRHLRRAEMDEWTPHRDMIRKIIADEPNAIDRAGGMMHMPPEFYLIRARLLARGKLALALEQEKNP